MALSSVILQFPWNAQGGTSWLSQVYAIVLLYALLVLKPVIEITGVQVWTPHSKDDKAERSATGMELQRPGT